jgi:membrane fusion protein (multidrug efflux system)
MTRHILMISLILLVPAMIILGAAYYLYPEKREVVLSSLPVIEMPDLGVAQGYADAKNHMSESYNNAANAVVTIKDDIGQSWYQTTNMINKTYDQSVDTIGRNVNALMNRAANVGAAIIAVPSALYDFVGSSYHEMVTATDSYIASIQLAFNEWAMMLPSFSLNDIAEMNAFAAFSDLESGEVIDPMEFAFIEPAAGGEGEVIDDPPPMEESFQFDIEENELTAEAVLVPRLKTVISSSRDGQIKKIHFENGDEFKKDDVILEYHCEDLRAEIGAAQAELKFAKTKKLTTSRLFNMELASKLEREQANVEASQTDAKNKTIEQRLNDCVIRADYDGRVVKKLANDNEYTRTDRVLMEVASKGTLEVEFLLSSRALRWVNVDAPISLFLSENEREYTGEIKQIYGEVDPVSQSIQIRAGLNDYDEPLLPGMSGALTVDISRIREAGIKGFLEVQ